jgi:hypothetical protein
VNVAERRDVMPEFLVNSALVNHGLTSLVSLIHVDALVTTNSLLIPAEGGLLGCYVFDQKSSGILLAEITSVMLRLCCTRPKVALVHVSPCSHTESTCLYMYAHTRGISTGC